MVPESGSSRAGFTDGSSKALYESIQAILSLPDSTGVFLGHGNCAPEGRDAVCEATVAEHKASNIHFQNSPSEQEFRQVRDALDQTLALPQLMFAALEISIRGGRLPEAEENGRSCLKVPLNSFSPN